MRSRQRLKKTSADTPGDCGMEGGSGLTKVNNKLDNLETSDPFLPPNTDTTSALEVVPVHNNVHHEVKGDWNPGDSSQANKLSVAKEGSCAVVVAVEES